MDLYKMAGNESLPIIYFRYYQSILIIHAIVKRLLVYAKHIERRITKMQAI